MIEEEKKEQKNITLALMWNALLPAKIRLIKEMQGTECVK